MKSMFSAALAAVSAVCAAAAIAGEFDSSLVGKVKYDDVPGWTISAKAEPFGEGRERWTIEFSAPAPTNPPRTTVSCRFPVVDVVGRMTTWAGNIPPEWNCGFSSAIHTQAPIASLFSDSSENRAMLACSEAFRRVNFRLGLVEETAEAVYSAELFSEPEAPIQSYRVEFLLDFRHVFYADAIRGAYAWMAAKPEYAPAMTPDAAFDPLYSFWYSYHQNVTAEKVEAECAEAVKYGMKTIIVDDGWQTDDNNRGYSYCGDWNVSTNRFPDFAAHVRRVQAMGLKYMIWYGVPFVGRNSANYARFKGMFLREDGDGVAVLDPRFPEVREFLIGNYEKAMREWGLDGLKLDFIDAFSFWGTDPAVAENYAGRDIKSVPEAVDRLMTDVRTRLSAIRKDVLIEFRQTYVGPAMRKYGNMFRASDCPMDPRSNRPRTLELRIFSGETAVHADMLMWNTLESPEAASKQFWSVLFAVPQISMRIEELPESHRAKLREMLDFWIAHRDTLMKGELRPMRPDLMYPIVYAYGKGEQVVAVYDAGQVVSVDRSKGADVYIVNATDATSVVVEENGVLRRVPAKPCSAIRLDAKK